MPLLEFCSKDFTTVKVTSRVGGVNGVITINYVYLPYDAADETPSRELSSLMEKQLER